MNTPQLPIKIPHIPTNRDHKALNRSTLGGLERCLGFNYHPAASEAAEEHPAVQMRSRSRRPGTRRFPPTRPQLGTCTVGALIITNVLAQYHMAQVCLKITLTSMICPIQCAFALNSPSTCAKQVLSTATVPEALYLSPKLLSFSPSFTSKVAERPV